MATEESKQIVREFCERFSVADAPGAIKYLDDDVSWGNESGLPIVW